MAEPSEARRNRQMITAARLADVWPVVRLRLLRRLVGGGVDRHTAEDIAQEVALRALATQVPYRDADDFCRWAHTVARNLLIDDTRFRARVTTVVELPDVPDGRDVAVQVEHRIALRRTFVAMAGMRAADREAIVEGVTATGDSSRPAAVRQAVRRHRARARLLRLVEGAVAVWAALRVLGRRTVAVPVSATLSAALLVLPAAVMPAAGPDPVPGSAPRGAGPDRAAAASGRAAASVRRAATDGEFGQVRRAGPAGEAAEPGGDPSEPGQELRVRLDDDTEARAGTRPPRREDCTVNTGNLPAPLPKCVNRPDRRDLNPSGRPPGVPGIAVSDGVR